MSLPLPARAFLCMCLLACLGVVAPAYALTEAECKANVDACFSEAEKSKPGEAAPLYQVLCDANKAEACLTLGHHFYGKEPAKAASFFEKACEAKNADACFLRAELSSKLKDDKAKVFNEKACELNQPTGCLGVANALQDTEEKKKYITKAVGLFDKECPKNPLSCTMRDVNRSVLKLYDLK